MAKEKEKTQSELVEESPKAGKSEVEVRYRAELNGGSASVKHGKYGIFLEVSKKIGQGSDGKPLWANVRMKGFEISALKDAITKYEVFAAKEELEVPST